MSSSSDYQTHSLSLSVCLSVCLSFCLSLLVLNQLWLDCLFWLLIISSVWLVIKMESVHNNWPHWSLNCNLFFFSCRNSSDQPDRWGVSVCLHLQVSPQSYCCPSNEPSLSCLIINHRSFFHWPVMSFAQQFVGKDKLLISTQITGRTAAFLKFADLNLCIQLWRSNRQTLKLDLLLQHGQ